MPNVAVIGSGFAGLSAASTLASKGIDVSLFEKNETVGGRARQFTAEGFTFDMGPSWYWMPEVFERFFNNFGYDVNDLYDLRKLDPSFRVFFSKTDIWDIPSEFEHLQDLFETVEPGAGNALSKFLAEAEYKYRAGMDELVYKPGNSISEFANKDIIKGLLKLQVFSSFAKHVRKYFKDPRLIMLMEFPVLFLGAQPKETPALYSLMNYAGLKLGTWYPMGGFGKIIEAMERVARENGVNIYTDEPVERIKTVNKNAYWISANGHSMEVNGVVAAADYHHVEQKLLAKEDRRYSENYWDSRTMAPSSLIIYLGLDKKLSTLEHHNLFFHSDFEQHSREIYKDTKWPEDPLFYVCCPSKTDPSVAPEGKENLFILIPIAPGLEDTEALRSEYTSKTIEQLEQLTGEEIKDHIIYSKDYCVKDFKNDYNSYKGNAYGLANTLRQTAFLKPKMKSKKINNLFFAGQLTTPGPGVPPSIISGQVSANELLKQLLK